MLYTGCSMLYCVRCQHAIELDLSLYQDEDAMNAAATKPGGLLSSFVRNLGVNVVGTQALTLQDIQPALVQLKSKLMDRNVAHEIANKYVAAKHSGCRQLVLPKPCLAAQCHVLSPQAVLNRRRL